MSNQDQSSVSNVRATSLTSLSERFRNVIVVTVTLLDASLRLELPALVQHLEFVAQSGLAVLTVNGTTGEFYVLTVDEAMTIVECATAMPGNGTTVAGITWACGTAEAWAPSHFVAEATALTSGLANVGPKLALAMRDALASEDDVDVHRIWSEVRPFEALQASNDGVANVTVLKEATHQLDLGPRHVRRLAGTHTGSEVEQLCKSSARGWNAVSSDRKGGSGIEGDSSTPSRTRGGRQVCRYRRLVDKRRGRKGLCINRPKSSTTRLPVSRWAGRAHNRSCRDSRLDRVTGMLVYHRIHF